MSVRRVTERVTGREIALGAVYATLDRLESKGLVSPRRARRQPRRSSAALAWSIRIMAAAGAPAYPRAMKMKLIFRFMALVLLPWAHGAWAQAPEWPEAIADNSFLVEEAYNQEPGVVQHVSTFFRQPGTAAGSDLSFSQEWPVRGQSHQLGYTLPYLLRDGGNGLGDLALHYRHQLRSDERGVALSPRVSLLLPAGRAGTRLAGVQVNLPVSRRWSAGLVTHANAGATHLVRDGAGGLRGYNLGASVVGLVHPRVNLLLEGVLAWAEANEGGRVVRERQLVVSPGLRGAIDVGTVQIVPGLAVPLTRDERGTHAGVFAYLSIEHPFEGPRRR